MSGKNNTEFPNIQRMFRELNREAFWGTLDEVKLEWVDDLGPGTEGTCTANTSTNTTSIQLSRHALQSKSPGRVAEVLARQMVHAYLHSTHAVDADKTDGPGFQKHWKRLLNLRDEYNRKQSDTLKTTGTSASSGKIGRTKPGSTLSSGRDKGKAPTWNFRPGARAHERKPEVVSSDDEEITSVKPSNPPSKPPFWTSFGPSTSKREDPVTRPKPPSSNKGKGPTWIFQPGSRAHERKPEVVSSDDEEVTYTKRPNPPSKPPFWTSFGPSTSKSEDPITPPRPTSSDTGKVTWNFLPGLRGHERKPEMISSEDEDVFNTRRSSRPTKSPFSTSFASSTFTSWSECVSYNQNLSHGSHDFSTISGFDRCRGRNDEPLSCSGLPLWLSRCDDCEVKNPCSPCDPCDCGCGGHC